MSHWWFCCCEGFPPPPPTCECTCTACYGEDAACCWKVVLSGIQDEAVDLIGTYYLPQTAGGACSWQYNIYPKIAGVCRLTLAVSWDSNPAPLGTYTVRLTAQHEDGTATWVKTGSGKFDCCPAGEVELEFEAATMPGTFDDSTATISVEQEEECDTGDTPTSSCALATIPDQLELTIPALVRDSCPWGNTTCEDIGGTHVLTYTDRGDGDCWWHATFPTNCGGGEDIWAHIDSGDSDKMEVIVDPISALSVGDSPPDTFFSYETDDCGWMESTDFELECAWPPDCVDAAYGVSAFICTIAPIWP